MSMTTALKVSLSGEISQAKLDKIRELLDLTKRGRLDDDEDANFGYRNLQRDETNQITLDLWRNTGTDWYLKLSYMSEPPAAGVVDQLRSDIVSAAGQLGLTVDRIWQREEGLGTA